MLSFLVINVSNVFDIDLKMLNVEIKTSDKYQIPMIVL